MKKLAAMLGAVLSAGSFAQGPMLPTSKGYTAATLHIERTVRQVLKDPTSAQFKPPYICAYGSNLKVAVVRVNSRNSFGGYTGFKDGLFMETDGQSQVLFPDPNASELAELESQQKLLGLSQSCLRRWADAARAQGVAVPGVPQ